MTHEYLYLTDQDFQDTLPGMFHSALQDAPMQSIRIGHSVAANDPRALLITEEELLQAPPDIASTLAVQLPWASEVLTSSTPGPQVSRLFGVQSWGHRHAIWVLIGSCFVAVGLLAAVSARLTPI